MRTLLAMLLVLTAAPAGAVDLPVFGKSLIVKRAANGKEKVVFVAVDPALSLPVGQADPLASSAGGALVEVVSSGASPVGAFVVPWGAPGADPQGGRSRARAARRSGTRTARRRRASRS
jgi:hypothetical protein